MKVKTDWKVISSEGWKNKRLPGFEYPTDLYARDPGEADFMIYSPDGLNELFASLIGSLRSPVAMWVKLLADDGQAKKLAAELGTVREATRTSGAGFEFSILWSVKAEENADPPRDNDP